MTINRRLFISSLVAVVASSALLSSGSSVESAVIPETSLTSARSLLLPGLWYVTGDYGSDYESDIMIDFRTGFLIVKVYRFSTKQELGFAISRISIDSGRYKAEFKPTLDRLFLVLSQGHLNEG